MLVWSKTPLGATLDVHRLSDVDVRRTTTDKGRLAIELVPKRDEQHAAEASTPEVSVLTGRDDVQTNEWLVACSAEIRKLTDTSNGGWTPRTVSRRGLRCPRLSISHTHTTCRRIARCRVSTVW